MRNQEGIDSSEIVVENEGAMMIQGDNGIQDQEEEEEEEEDYGQEMNIEGGEQNIDDDEQEYGEEQ